MSSAEKAYSPCVQVENTIYVAGQVSNDSTGTFVGAGDIVLQTKQVFANLSAILATKGATLNDVVMVNVYLTDIKKDFKAMDEEYRKYFSLPYPARATVGSPLVDEKYLIEITATAVKRN